MDRVQKRLILFIFFLGLTAIFVNIVPLGRSVPLKDDLKMFPKRIGHWVGYDILSDKDNTRLEVPPNVDDFLYRRYQKSSDEDVVFYIGYSGKFRHGDSIFLGDYVGLSYDWTLIKENEKSIIFNGKNISIKKVIFKRGRQCFPVSYWYQTNVGVVADRDRGRFSRAFDAILNRKTNVALIRVSSGSLRPENCTFGSNHDDFFEEILPHLEKFLPFEF